MEVVLELVIGRGWKSLEVPARKIDTAVEAFKSNWWGLRREGRDIQGIHTKCHIQNIGRNKDGNSHSDEISGRNKEYVTDNRKCSPCYKVANKTCEQWNGHLAKDICYQSVEGVAWFPLMVHSKIWAERNEDSIDREKGNNIQTLEILSLFILQKTRKLLQKSKLGVWQTNQLMRLVWVWIAGLTCCPSRNNASLNLRGQRWDRMKPVRLPGFDRQDHKNCLSLNMLCSSRQGKMTPKPIQKSGPPPQFQQAQTD